MSIPIPLAVELSSSRGTRRVTRQIRDLSIRWTDPGGHQSCRISLDRPLRIQPDEIAYYSNLRVTDARSAAVVFDGRLEDPGRSAGQGQVWDIVATGGQAHTKDRTVPVIYVDQPLSGLERVDNFTPGARDSVGADPGDTAGLRQALVLQFPAGLPVVSNSRVAMRYNGITKSGQKLARVDYQWDAGLTTPSILVEAVARVDGNLGGGTVFRSQTLSTSGAGLLPKVIGTDWVTDRTTVEWRILYTSGAATLVSDVHWASIWGMVVQGTRYDRTGTELLTGASYPNNYILASDVVADLLGRLLTSYDGANATITPASYQIQRLAYPDGADAAKILADLLALESGFTWRVWERGASGKYRFEFVPIPSVVRYEATLVDGYDSPGSADGLYNRVTVLWRDSSGHIQTTTRTATVPLLDNASPPLIRQGRIDLGSEVGSQADAERAGDQWLADRKYPPNAGRLRIARPILDIQTGRMVQPWELRPGLIRVRGILPRVDALNATARDGTTVFRIRACEYRASDAAATLELDSYAPSTAQMLADARLLAEQAITRR